MKELAEVMSQYTPQSDSELQELHERPSQKMKEWSIPNESEQETGVII